MTFSFPAQDFKKANNHQCLINEYVGKSLKTYIDRKNTLILLRMGVFYMCIDD